MSDVRSEGEANEGVPQSGALATTCGPVTVTVNGVTKSIDDECLCGCDAYYHRCERWSYDGPTSSHPCC
jgi:hypothetical protein